MTKDVEQLAIQIFLRRLPNEHVTDKTLVSIRSLAQQAVETAEVFYEELAKKNEQDPLSGCSGCGGCQG